MKIRVIARTTDDSVYVVRVGGPKHGRTYLELESRIPESWFPREWDSLPLSDDMAYNAELYPYRTLEIENFKNSENGEVNYSDNDNS